MIKYILKISAITTLCITLFAAFGCAKQNGIKLPFCGGDACKTPLSPSAINCSHSSFLGGLETWLSLSTIPLYVIKGVALDTYNNYGRRIKLVEDLIGNLPENTDTLIVWGNTGGQLRDTNDSYWAYGRLEYLACYDCYKKGNTLIMLLQRPSLILSQEPERDWTTTEYFTTFGLCVSSVLWLRNDYVTGNISWEWTEDYSVQKNRVTRMSWHGFQRELNNVVLQTNK